MLTRECYRGYKTRQQTTYNYLDDATQQSKEEHPIIWAVADRAGRLAKKAVSKRFSDNGTSSWSTSFASGANNLPFVTGKEQSLDDSHTQTANTQFSDAALFGHRVVDGVPVQEYIGEAGESVEKLLPRDLMNELAQSGVKYNRDDVVTVVKTPDGKVMWLEKGTSSSGLQHIVDGHATDFANRGINDIIGFINRALQEKPVKTGMTKAGPYAEYLIDGKMYRVGYGTNGYIVLFYPIK